MNYYFEKAFKILKSKTFFGAGNSMKRSFSREFCNNPYKKTFFIRVSVLLFDTRFTVFLQKSLSNK